jgi:hypothetical protein
LTGDGDVLETGTSTLSFTFKSGVFGNFFVIASGGSPRKVDCTFIQKGYARESAAPNARPFVPWNFHFWPFARTFTDGTKNPHAGEAENILRKYARAFGKSEKVAAEWEHDHHGLDVGDGWMGHCHLAAAASILFEQPIARTMDSRAGRGAPVAFTEDDLELLATEWVGNFCDQKPQEYSVAEGADVWDHIPEMKGQRYVHLLKPSDLDLPVEQLKEVFKKAVTAFAPAFDSSKVDAMADRASRLSPPQRDAIKETFGQRGHFLYQVLIDQILVRGEALEGDLCAAGAGNGPNEVWNHAVFYYEAHFRAIDGSADTDPLFVEVTILMVANADLPEPPSPGAPADVLFFRGGRAEVNVNQTRWESRKVRQVMNLAFSVAGDLIEDRRRNRWLHAQSGDGGRELYAPRYLAVIAPVQANPGENFHVESLDDRYNGNVMVTLDLVNASDPLLKIRKRYRL